MMKNMKKIHNEALTALFLFNGIFVFGNNLIGPLYALFAQQFDNKIFSVSVSWAVFLISTTVFTWILSSIGDKIKEKEYLLIAGYSVRAIAWFAFGFITGINQLLILQAVLGFGEALGTPAFDAIFSQHVDNGKQIKEYSWWKVVSNLVLVGGTVIGGLLVDRFGFRNLFWVMSFCSLISAVGIWLKPRKLL